MDGYETVKRLKSQDHTSTIPVVIVTALNDVANQIKSIEAGADDFLSKPVVEKLLIAKVKLLSALNIERKKARQYAELLQEINEGRFEINNGNLSEKINDIEEGKIDEPEPAPEDIENA
jgi:two-component system cell cycle response regulator